MYRATPIAIAIKGTITAAAIAPLEIPLDFVAKLFTFVTFESVEDVVPPEVEPEFLAVQIGPEGSVDCQMLSPLLRMVSSSWIEDVEFHHLGLRVVYRKEHLSALSRPWNTPDEQKNVDVHCSFPL